MRTGVDSVAADYRDQTATHLVQRSTLKSLVQKAPFLLGNVTAKQLLTVFTG